MTASYEKIDYSLRIGKYAERRMLCDVIRRLSPFGPVEEYEYIGFGSVWFADFSLFHRNIGFREMTSIEGEPAAEARVHFNRPYRIKVHIGYSGAVLPHLQWTSQKVVWLDYDDPIDRNMLIDARTVATNAASGSLVVISVPCAFAPETQGREDPQLSRTDRFANRFDRGQVPERISERQLLGWPFGQLARQMFTAQIEDALETRALTKDRLFFKEVCSFEYADGVKMTTIVGVLYSEQEANKLSLCNFPALDFLPESSTVVRIENPKLTPKEIRHLEAQLPWPRPGPIEHRAIPVEEVAKFSRYYRYFPKFSTIEA